MDDISILFLLLFTPIPAVAQNRQEKTYICTLDKALSEFDVLSRQGWVVHCLH